MTVGTGIGIQRFARERARQYQLGYTPKHDAEHVDGELAAAAMCYAAAANPSLDPDGTLVAMLWPWPDEAPPSPTEDPERLLEVAGALLAAELDRYIAQDEQAAS